MLLQSQPLSAACSDPTPLYPWQPGLQGLAVVAVVVFAIAVVADVTSACHSCCCSQVSSVGLLGLSFAPPPSTFVLPPSSIAPHQQRRAAAPVFTRVRVKKMRAPSLYASTAPCVCGALPYMRRPPLVSSSPFPMFNDSPLCPGPSSLYAANSPLCPGTSSPYGETAIGVRGALPYMRPQPLVFGSPFPIRGDVSSCPGARSLWQHSVSGSPFPPFPYSFSAPATVLFPVWFSCRFPRTAFVCFPSCVLTPFPP